MKIYPAILSGDIRLVQQQLDLAMSFIDCDVVQIDLLDGLFADNLTITPADLASCEFGELKCDLHIMAIDPEDVVNEATEFATLLPIRSIIAQVEKMGNEQAYVEAVHRQGWHAGLSLDVDTAIESIDDAIWKELQHVQVMGVQAGEQGQAFVERSLDLVKEIYQLRQAQGLRFELLIDGGVRTDLIAKLASQHVDSCVVGSLLWKSSNPAEQWRTIAD